MGAFDVNFFGVIHQSGGCGPELLGALDLLARKGKSARCILPTGDFTVHGDRAQYLMSRGVHVEEYRPGMFSQCPVLMSFGEGKCFEYMCSYGDKPPRMVWSSCMANSVGEEVAAFEKGLIDEFFFQTERTADRVSGEIFKKTGKRIPYRPGYQAFIDVDSSFGCYGQFIDKDPDSFKICKAVRDDPEKYDPHEWFLFSSIVAPAGKPVQFEMFGFGDNGRDKIGDPCDVSSKWNGKLNLKWHSHVVDPKRVSKLYGSSHALLHVYPFLENYPRATLEAMLSQTVPVVYGQGGFLDQIIHGVTGFLCASVDEAIYYTSKLAFEESLRQKMGIEGRRWVLEDGPGNQKNCWEWWRDFF